MRQYKDWCSRTWSELPGCQLCVATFGADKKNVSALQCVAVCGSVLQCVAVWRLHGPRGQAAGCVLSLLARIVGWCAAVCCSVMQCVAVCCRVVLAHVVRVARFAGCVLPILPRIVD